MIVHDQITGLPRLVAPARSKRLGPRPDGCPFCAGNEGHTPAEIERVSTDAGGWSSRSVPNLFPLVPGHEVLITTPRHVTSVRELTVEEWVSALQLWSARHAHHTASAAADELVHLFINDGKAAGASIPHSHAQLLTMPATAMGSALSDRAVENTTDGCSVCAAASTIDPTLIVWQTEALMIFASPTPRTGGSLILCPRTHTTTIADSGHEQVAQAMQRAWTALDDGDANAWLVQRPQLGSHWYIELVPRGPQLAGVELALGYGIAPWPAEETAERARERISQRQS